MYLLFFLLALTASKEIQINEVNYIKSINELEQEEIIKLNCECNTKLMISKNEQCSNNIIDCRNRLNTSNYNIGDELFIHPLGLVKKTIKISIIPKPKIYMNISVNYKINFTCNNEITNIKRNGYKNYDINVSRFCIDNFIMIFKNRDIGKTYYFIRNDEIKLKY